MITPKKQLILFVSTIFLVAAAIELAFQTFPIPTNASEAKKVQIRALERSDFDYALFGSSASNVVLGSNPYVYENVFNGTTVGATTLYGQYFLFLELYDRTKKLKKVFFSFVPRMLSYGIFDGDKKRVVRFFNNTFTEKRYVDLLRSINKEYEPETDYFIDRRFYVDTLLRHPGKVGALFFSGDKASMSTSRILAEAMPERCEQASPNIRNKISHYAHGMKDLSVNAEYLQLVEMLGKFNRSSSVKVVFVLEPAPLSEYSEFIKSKAYSDFKRSVEANGMTFIDANEKFLFKDCYFQDQLHLKNRYLITYKRIMAKYIFVSDSH